MKNNYLFILLMVPAWLLAGHPEKHLIAKGAIVQKLAGGFSFTEGPAADSFGNVYFTDQPNNRILIWTVSGELKTFLRNSGRANGLYFDKKGNLLACADMHNELWSISLSDTSHTVLIPDFNGHKLNGPNDLWVAPDGSIYFTDPLYVRPYWTRQPESQQSGEYVYRVSADYSEITCVARDLQKPNGIIGSPDGKKLYIADIGAGKTYCYAIEPDGSLGNKTLFANMGSDGMTIDEQGNVYLTGNGVSVFNEAGEKIAQIEVDALWTANVCFGGKNMRMLFITASDGLFALKMKVKGVK